jgi:hypothetical protein
MKTLEIIPVGSQVLLLKELPVTITAANIRSGNRLQYEVSWVNGSSHTCKWVEECEVSTDRKTRQPIGFGGKPNG